jgi:hypothetical protein
MKSIFLSGASGTGKSTFAKIISDRYDIPIRKEVTRQLDEILKTSFANRQLFFSLNYVNRHMSSRSEQFISDRTILDYIFWTSWIGEPNHIMMTAFMEIIHQWFVDGDIVVIPPTPSYDTFKEIIFPGFMSDLLRYSIYIGKHHDIYGFTPYTTEEFCGFVYKMSVAMHKEITNVLGRFSGKINVISPINSKILFTQPKSSVVGKLEIDYWDWQKTAIQELDKTFL